MNKKGNITRGKPIKEESKIKAIAEYLKETDKERGQASFIIWILCVNCGLRVTDALELRVSNICGNRKKVKENIIISEKKTGKLRYMHLGNNVRKEIQEYINGLEWNSGIKYQSYLFPSPRIPGKHISYKWIYKRIKEAASVCGINDNCATHVMRKTFARRWYDTNLKRYDGSVTRCAAALQENILHHGRLETTLRYIDAEEEYIKETCSEIDITT